MHRQNKNNKLRLKSVLYTVLIWTFVHCSSIYTRIICNTGRFLNTDSDEHIVHFTLNISERASLNGRNEVK